jgi:hypothetical protein
VIISFPFLAPANNALKRAICLPGSDRLQTGLDLDQEHLISALPSAGMNSNDEKQRKEKPPPPRDLESRRKVIEEYIADLRALLDKLRRMLN